MVQLVYKSMEIIMKLQRRKPMQVFLDNYSESSTRTVLSTMNKIAGLLSGGKADAMSLEWESVRYEHYAALRKQFEQIYKPSTANRCLAFIKKMARVLQSMELITPSRALAIRDIRPFKETNELAGRLIDIDEIENLLEMPLKNKNTAKGLRDYAMLLLLITSGVRRSELANLSVKDFDYETGSIDILEGKNNNSRIIYLPQRTAEAIYKWLQYSGFINHPNHRMFCAINKGGSISDRELSGTDVYRTICGYVDKTELTRLSPHDFRRTYISLLIDKGVDLVTVSKIAGHSDIKQTVSYDRRNDDAKQRAVTAVEDMLNG